MNCLGQLTLFNNVKDNLSRKYDIIALVEHVKDVYYITDIDSRVMNALLPITQLINNHDFIKCIQELQKYTLTPSWYYILNIFFIDDPSLRIK